jgi:long-chain acyl-CoA synthetase
MLNAEAAANIADACARSHKKAFLMARLKSIDATPDPHEKLRCVVVVTTAWTVENDVFTPTFKVKRNRIEDLNANNHEAWVASGKRVIWQAS